MTADKWGRMDPDEGSFLITYGDTSGTSGPGALTTSSHRAGHKVCASRDQVAMVHLDRLGAICHVGH